MRIIVVYLFIVALFGLTSCTRYQTRSVQFFAPYQGNEYGDYQSYSDPEYRQYNDYQQESTGVRVPDSYHVGSYRSPTRHRSRDNRWVNQQNPRGYTIQLSEGSKASLVAKTLTKAPKRNRMATVSSSENGQKYYRGVYGTFTNYDEAKQAFDSLPHDLKNGARIKQWGSLR